jgi:lipopolysaccharide transport system permease protein
MNSVEGPVQPGPPIQVTEIRPSTGWVSLRLGEIWRYRELLYFFVWRDIKVRYKQTAFGALWAIIQPLALMVVFTLVFSRLGGISPPGVPYALFAFAGLVPWTLFSSSLIGSSNSLVDSAALLTKVYFPRLLLPIAASGSYLLDFAITLVLLFGLMLILGVIPTLTVLWILPLTLLLLGASVGVGLWLSAINVRYRDVRYAIPFIAQLWLFASPVAYSSAIIPSELWFLYHLNPMAGVIEGFRWALSASAVAAPVAEVTLATVVSLLVVATGLVYFRSTERTFADVV